MSITVKDFEGLMDLLKSKLDELNVSLKSRDYALVKVIDKLLDLTNANMNDVLDERNDSRYWEGYKDALNKLKLIVVGVEICTLNQKQ